MLSFHGGVPKVVLDHVTCINVCDLVSPSDKPVLSSVLFLPPFPSVMFIAIKDQSDDGFEIYGTLWADCALEFCSQVTSQLGLSISIAHRILGTFFKHIFQ